MRLSLSEEKFHFSGGSFADGTRWIDKSTANNAHAVQANTDNRPSVVSDGLNGMSVVRFDGNDIMDVDSGAFGMLNNVSGATLFGLVKTGVTSGQRVFSPGREISLEDPGDGLSIDTGGNLYITQRQQTAVDFYSPDGLKTGRISLPLRPTNCTFGGKNMRTLFMTARTAVYTVQMNKRGHRFTVAP